MLFDTHAHYESRAFAQDRETLLRSLPSEGVSLVLCPGSNVERSLACVDLAARHPHVYAAVGIHPHDAPAQRPSYLKELEAMLSAPKVVAIGEIGLDYYYSEGNPRPVQQAIFRAQMELAASHGLPVIVHDRDAHADSMRVVRDYPTVHGVFHCYAGGVEQALELVSLGYAISFTGNITFKNARRAPEVIRALPLSSILLETDAPYMTPVPHRGKRNDSRYLHRVAETIAELKGLTVEEVVKTTRANGIKLFALKGVT